MTTYWRTSVLISFMALVFTFEYMVPATRAVAFDNSYGVDGKITAIIAVDHDKPVKYAGTCYPKTYIHPQRSMNARAGSCRVNFPATAGMHTVAVAVEIPGYSVPSTATLITHRIEPWWKRFQRQVCQTLRC